MSHPLSEFALRIDEIVGTVARVIFTLPGQRNNLERELSETGWPETSTITVATFGDAAAPPVHSSTFAERIAALRPGGHDEVLIGNVCLAYIYSLWEDKYREQFAIRLGRQKNEVRSDVFMELGAYRHAIVHNASRGTAKTEGLKLLPAVPSGSEVRVDRHAFEHLVGVIKTELEALVVQPRMP